MTTTVAFIGLGVMGYPMAGHLAEAGITMTVYNRSGQRAQQWTGDYPGFFFFFKQKTAYEILA